MGDEHAILLEIRNELGRVSRGMFGETTPGGQVIYRGLNERVARLEHWRILAILALFGGSFAGNVVARVLTV